MGKFIEKKRKILDDNEVSILDIIQHSFVNGMYGFNSGFVIAFVSIFIREPNARTALLLICVYFVHKQVESKILNRNKYVTKLGRNFIFPIPSTIGFVLGAYISTLI